ncbi:MFS transporter, DHA1 family, multidrug resistance protein [Marivirga sericea]|jgi:DHA1 family multidrug resistance protein-like MFS transporter|uniref:MFS transporter, DHA1 family, multidrug resistance protein n=1 Tax=Marivirga sericea TaxID=1028 RepID=A0A1X7J5N8_9BACT|nr:MFS transporter [Marivirga sericea]SMG22889.1 MFS transporter, DHA1 family, multidrug resistance protein [Marivirga sericea]|tara:strand:+ start:131186 stop:132415 length:1230 start_codon:yes stop_codon:yes gene_type:complete
MGNREMLGGIIIVLLSIFVVMSGYGVLLPVLPYYTERLALKSGVVSDENINYHIGILTSIYPFFQLLFAVVWGKLSDRFGRKVLIVMGLAGFALMQIMTGLANSLTILYVARILGGIFSSAVIPASNAYLSDLTNSKQRRKILAWSGVAVSAGVIAGPMIGGYLAQTNLHFNTAIGHFLLNRFSVPFLAIALLGIVALVVVMLWLKKPKKQHTNKQQGKLKTTGMLANTVFLKLLLLSLVIQLAVTLFETVFSVYAKDILIFDATQVGLGFMLCGLIMAILQPLFASFDENILPMKLQLIIGFLLAALSMGLFTLIKADYYVFSMIIIFATGGAMVTPNLIASISFIDENNTGTYLSTQTSTNSIGQVLGPLLGMWIYSFGNSWPFLIIGITLLLVTILIMPGLKLNKS